MEKKVYTSAELAKIAGGELIGNPELKISGIGSLKDAGEGQISFLSNKKYSALLKETKASAVLIGKDVQIVNKEKVYILAENPNLAFSKIVSLFAPPQIKFEPGISDAAYVSKTAKIGQRVHIGHHAVIEDEVEIGDDTIIGAGVYVGHYSKIGKGTLIYPNVSIRERTIIGNRVIIHCGAVIGADGFGFEAGANGIVKIEQVGIVEIQDDVEIGANTTIDRARFGKTILKRGVKIDNLVQVAHNVIIGEFSMLIGQSGIAGSSELGRGVILAAQAGVSGHLKIGDGAKIAGQAGVTKDIPPGQSQVGTPAELPKEFMERLNTPKKIRNLSSSVAELQKKVDELEKEIKRLKNS